MPTIHMCWWKARETWPEPLSERSLVLACTGTVSMAVVSTVSCTSSIREAAVMSRAGPI